MKLDTLSRRDLLKLGAGAAGAVVGNKIFDEIPEWNEASEGVTTQQAYREIARFREEERQGIDNNNLPYTYFVGFDHDEVLKQQASVPANDYLLVPDIFERSRHRYLYEYFSRTTPRFMPKAIMNRIAPLMPGLAAQETRFQPDLTSSGGAVTIMQFLPSTYADLGGQLSVDELRNDFAEQVEFAFKFLDERVWKHFENEGVDFEAIGRKFGVSGPELEAFTTLSVINGFKAGQGNMVDVLKGFQRGFAVRSLPDSFDHTGLGLFYIMSNFMSGYGRSIEPNYGEHSHEYPLKVIAGAESLGDEFNQPYGLKVSRSGLLAKSVGAGVGVVIADGLFDSSHKRKSVKQIPKDLALSTVKSPLTAAQLVSRSVVSVLKPKQALKNLASKATSKKAKPKTSTKKASPKGKKMPQKRKPSLKAPKLSRRQLIGLGSAGVLGAGAIFKDQILDVVSDLFPRGLDNRITSLEVPAELRRLNDRGIFLSSSWEDDRESNPQELEENGEIDACGRTTLTGMRELVLDTVVQLLDDLEVLDPSASHEDDDGAIVFTGGAEGCGHSNRTHGHGEGYAIDLRRSSSDRVERALIDQTTVTNRFTRQLYPEHKLVQSGLVVGDKIFRFNSKYFLFGVQNQGQTFVCYFDAESSHRHIEMIPWNDYNVESQDQFAREADLPRTMRGIWRESVRDHIRANL